MPINSANALASDAQLGRDPEDRPVAAADESAIREMLDKTLADTYPASDPLSSIPNPSSDSVSPDEVVRPGLDRAA